MLLQFTGSEEAPEGFILDMVSNANLHPIFSCIVYSCTCIMCADAFVLMVGFVWRKSVVKVNQIEAMRRTTLIFFAWSIAGAYGICSPGQCFWFAPLFDIPMIILTSVDVTSNIPLNVGSYATFRFLVYCRWFLVVCLLNTCLCCKCTIALLLFFSKSLLLNMLIEIILPFIVLYLYYPRHISIFFNTELG